MLIENTKVRIEQACVLLGYRTLLISCIVLYIVLRLSSDETHFGGHAQWSMVL